MRDSADTAESPCTIYQRVVSLVGGDIMGVLEFLCLFWVTWRYVRHLQNEGDMRLVAVRLFAADGVALALCAVAGAIIMLCMEGFGV